MPTRTRTRQTGLMAGALLALMATVVVAYTVTAPVPHASADEPGAPAAESLAAPLPAPGTVAPAATPAAAPPPSSVAPPAPAPAAATSSGGQPPPAAAPLPTGTTVPAPAAEAPAAEAPAAPVVAMIGDSIGFSAASALDAALRASGVTPALELAPGRRIAEWGLDGEIGPALDSVQALKALDPTVWVVELGTNDIDALPFDRQAYTELVVSVLDLIGPGVPVAWLNVHRGDRPAESRAFDDVLRLLAAQRPELIVADWDAVARAEPVLGPDGVHLTLKGVSRLVDTVLWSVALAQRAAAPTA